MSIRLLFVLMMLAGTLALAGCQQGSDTGTAEEPAAEAAVEEAEAGDTGAAEAEAEDTAEEEEEEEDE